jgi:uncharacterized integral membrane protein
MHFLKTLFWVLLAVVVTAFAFNNWADVTVNLWSDLQADVKLPLLLIVSVLLGFLPTYLILRGRLWSLQRRLEAHERSAAAPTTAAPAPTLDANESAA